MPDLFELETTRTSSEELESKEMLPVSIGGDSTCIFPEGKNLQQILEEISLIAVKNFIDEADYVPIRDAKGEARYDRRLSLAEEAKSWLAEYESKKK